MGASLIVTTQFILTLSLAYAVAALQVPYRDTQYLLGIALFLGFYLCPVFYSASSIPPAFRFAYRSNPLVHIIEAYRDVLIAGHVPALVPLLIISACAIAAMVSAAYFSCAAVRGLSRNSGGRIHSRHETR